MPIDTDEWVEQWSPDLDTEGIRVAVFQTPDEQAVGVPAQRLKRDLEAETRPIPPVSINAIKGSSDRYRQRRWGCHGPASVFAGSRRRSSEGPAVSVAGRLGTFRRCLVAVSYDMPQAGHGRSNPIADPHVGLFAGASEEDIDEEHSKAPPGVGIAGRGRRARSPPGRRRRAPPSRADPSCCTRVSVCGPSPRV